MIWFLAFLLTSYVLGIAVVPLSEGKVDVQHDHNLISIPGKGWMKVDFENDGLFQMPQATNDTVETLQYVHFASMSVLVALLRSLKRKKKQSKTTR